MPGSIWISPLDNASVDIAGTLNLEWEGASGAIDVAVALRRNSDGVTLPLYTNTVAKPNPASSVKEQVLLAVQITNLTVRLGDQVIVTHRAAAPAGAFGANLYDALHIFPSSPDRYATVTINVGANQSPVANLQSDGSALHFDGANDVVRVENNSALQITGDQTIEFWIRPDNFSARRNPINKAYGGEGTMTIEADGRINYFYGTGGGDGGSYQTFNSVQPLRLGVWQHVALVRDLTNMKLRWYFDGQLIAEATANYSSATASGNPLSIGNGYAGPTAGDLDEVRIWKVARTSNEIQTGMLNRMNGDEAGLAGYWNFDEGAGTVATNQTALLLNGSLGAGNANQMPVWISSMIPFSAAPTTLEDNDLVLTLAGTDADGDALTPRIVRDPLHGRFYQYGPGGTRGAVLESDAVLHFDGVDDVVGIPETAAADLTSHPQWSISAWIQLDGAEQAYPTIYSEGHWAITLGIQSGTGRLDSWVNDAAQLISTTNVPFGRWAHVAVVCDGSSRTFYIDGAPAGSGSAPAVSPNAQGAAIGGIIDELSNARNRFHGSINDVALWSRALTASEILAQSTVPLAGDETGLIALWRFNDDPQGPFVESRGTGADGVSGNGVAARQPEQTLGRNAAFAFNSGRIDDPQGRVIYAPDTNWSGADSFLFAVNDGKVDSASAEFRLRVLPVNDAPIAVPDSVFAIAGFAQEIPSVLSNDFDVEGDAFHISSHTLPAHGVLIDHGDGSFKYTPDAGFSGMDAFEYQLSDGISNGLPAVVSITVAPYGEFRWTNVLGGNWSNPANWNQNRIPGTNDDVIIDLPGDYTITLDADAQVRRILIGAASGSQTLRLNSRTLTLLSDSFVRTNGVLDFPSYGVLENNHYLLIAGTFRWRSGLLKGAGVTELAPGSTAAFSNGSTRRISDGQRLWNRTTLELADGTLQLGNENTAGATLENSGIMNISNGVDVLWWNFNSSRPVVFVNEGQIRQLGQAQSDIQVPFQNAGDVSIESVLRLNQGGQMSGSVSVGSGAALLLAGGDFQFSGAAGISGPGELRLQSGSATFDTRLQLTGGVTVSGGAWNFNVDQTFPSFTQTAGDLGGSANFMVTTQFSFSGGEIFGPGTFEIASTATAALTGGDKYLNNGRRLLNRGSLLMSSGNLYLGNQNIGGARVENQGTLTLADEADVRWWNFDSSRPVGFVNHGVVHKTGAGRTEVLIPFDNAGVLDLQQGTLRLAAGGTISGTNQIAGAATMQLDGGSFDFTGPSRLAGAGALQLLSGNGRFATALEIQGPISMSSGSWIFAADQRIPDYTQSGGTLAGTNHILVSTNFNFTGGVIRGAGTFELAPGVMATLNGRGDRELAEGVRFVNRATLNLSDGRLLLGNDVLPGATFENFGTLNLTNSARIVWHNYNNNPVALINRGTFNQQGGTNTIDLPFANEGVMDLRQGVLVIEQDFIQNGSALMNDGTVLRYRGGACTVGADSLLLGQGTFRLETGSLIVDHDWTISPDFEFIDGTLAGAGTVTVAGDFVWNKGQMTGAGMTELLPGTSVTISNTADKILSGGRRLRNHSTLDLSGKGLTFNSQNPGGAMLENEGTLMISDEADLLWTSVNLNNPASLVNSGVVVKSGPATISDVNILFTNTGVVRIESGTLRFRQNTWQAGTLNVLTNAELQFVTAGTNRIAAGNQFLGTGTVLIQRPMELLADANFGTLDVTFGTGSSFSGLAKVANEPGGILRINQSMTFPGDISVGGRLIVGNAAHTLNVLGSLFLGDDGILENPGTIKVADFIDAGGTIIGHAPQINGIASARPLKISSLKSSNLANKQLRGSVTYDWVIHCTAPAGSSFVVETSTDLRSWHQATAMITETTPGNFEVQVQNDASNAGFFRLRSVSGN